MPGIIPRRGGMDYEKLLEICQGILAVILMLWVIFAGLLVSQLDGELREVRDQYSFYGMENSDNEDGAYAAVSLK